MADYIILNSIILALILVVININKHSRVFAKQKLISLGVLLLLTAVFDNLIIMSGIVAYDPDSLLGLYVYRAPVEDFMYSIAAILLIPYIWERARSA